MRTQLILPIWALVAVACDDGTSVSPGDVAWAADMAADAERPGLDAAPADAEPPDLDAAPRLDAAPATRLVLNEVDCRDAPWIELYAPDGPVRPEGWRLEVGARTHTLGEPIEGFVRVPVPGVVTCGHDEVALVGPDGARQPVTPPLDVAAVTWGRLPDAEGPWQATAPTPAAPNATPAPAPTALFDGALHGLTLELAEGAVPVLDRNRGAEVDGALAVGVEAARPARVIIRAADGRSRRADQKGTFRLRFTDDGALDGLDLHPGLPDPAALTEWIALSMLGEAGLAVPRVGLATLTVDGADLGLYTVIEATRLGFAARWFPSTWHVYTALRADLVPDDIDRFSAEVGPDSDSRDLRWLTSLLEAEQLLGTTRYGQIADFVDWPQVVEALAAEAWLGSAEGYGPTRQNLRLHVDRQTRFSLIPDGLDVALRPLDPYRGAGRLLQVCLEHAGCRADYEAALVDLTARFAEGDWPARIRAQAAAVRPAVVADPARFWPVEMFDAGAEAAASFVESRLAEMTALAACLAEDPDADEDGYRCGADCAPDDPARHLAAVDVCGNGVDEDCNGVVDDGPDCPRCRAVTRGGVEYLLCPTARQYAAAAALCASLEATLARFDGPGEARWVHDQAQRVQRQNWWIGLSDAAEEGAFLWADGEPPGYTRWANGQPDDAGGIEDCVHLRTDGLWNDIDCRNRFGAVCERPCAPRDADGDGVDGCALDCDDADPDLPAEVDLCGDGVDQDCNGVPDDGPDCPCATAWRGERRYLFCPERVNAEALPGVCAERDMVPVSIDDAEENAWVYDQARARRYQRWWIGLSDAAEEGRYRWSDGSPLRFGAWSRGEPNDSGRNEDCVHFWEDRPQWNDIACGARNGVICEPP